MLHTHQAKGISQPHPNPLNNRGSALPGALLILLRIVEIKADS